jgi:SAM-dependent methyltransferase
MLTRHFFQRYVPEDATVLDLGCGWGEFINHVRARKRLGMDLNPDSARHLDSTVTFLHQDCSIRWPLPDDSLDVVFTSNFLEHLPEKRLLRDTIAEVYRCTRPGGRLVCVGPNVKRIPGAYWDFWDHYLPLTELSLTEALELEGFAVEECRGRFLPYTMSAGWKPPLWSVAIYLKLPVLWPLLGKQFLVVGRKAAGEGEPHLRASSRGSGARPSN